MQRSSLAIAIALAASSFSSLSQANGLAINEQSVSGMGTSFAGRASSAQDASTIYGNPAGMSKLGRTEVSGGLAFIKPSTDISDVQTSQTGTSDGDIAPNAAVPFAFISTPLNDKWHFGLGVYVPFAVISDNEKAFQGRNYGLYSKVQVMTLQPTFSYKINDRVAVGFGPTINKIDGHLTSKLNTAFSPALSDTKVNVKGDDIGYGYNLGLLVDVTDATTWGITYHSKIDFKLEGRTKVDTNAATLNLLGQTASQFDAQVDITMPESIDTSITHRFNEKWTGYAGATWTRWSRLENITVDNKGANGILSRTVEEMGWIDTMAYAIGASYQLTPKVVLRAGFALDQTPTTNAHRNVRIPVGDRRIFSLGAGFAATDDLTVDIAYAYIREEEVDVDQAAGLGRTGYVASYKNSAHGVGTQLTYRF